MRFVCCHHHLHSNQSNGTGGGGRVKSSREDQERIGKTNGLSGAK